MNVHVHTSNFFPSASTKRTLRDGVDTALSLDLAADLFDADLNRTLATLPRRLIVTVATHEYLPLTRNLLCSSLQWWSAAAAVGILVAGADSWLCAELAPLHASVACVDPPIPHHLAASALEVYELKLRLAVRAAQLGHEVFMADGATVLFENPFASLPELPHASLLLSFQDRLCLHLSVCDTRTTPTPSPDHASTIFFFLAPEPSSAAALVDRAADLLRQEGPQNRSLYGDQEALREVLRRQEGPPGVTPAPHVKWTFLPFPAFVRSMSWHHPTGVAGHDDAELFGSVARRPSVYAAGMTQRGLTAAERVAVKRAALQRAGLWLVQGDGINNAAVTCNGSWRRRPFSRDPWRSPAPPPENVLGTARGMRLASAESAAAVAAVAEHPSAMPSTFSIAPAGLRIETIRHLYTQAALLLQQPVEVAPRAWWHAALHVRALEALWREHLEPRPWRDRDLEPRPSRDRELRGPSAALHSDHAWLTFYRSTSPKVLWEIGQRAQQAAVTPRAHTEQGVVALRVALALACRSWRARLQRSAAVPVSGEAEDADREAARDALEELRMTLALVSEPRGSFLAHEEL